MKLFIFLLIGITSKISAAADINFRCTHQSMEICAEKTKNELTAQKCDVITSSTIVCKEAMDEKDL